MPLNGKRKSKFGKENPALAMVGGGQRGLRRNRKTIGKGGGTCVIGTFQEAQKPPSKAYMQSSGGKMSSQSWYNNGSVI